jgi:hypothetical protein
MKKFKSVIFGALIALVFTSVSGCTATDASKDGYESFAAQFTESFNKNMELSENSPYVYTSEIAGSTVRNTIYKDNRSLSIFDLRFEESGCPIKFDLIGSSDNSPSPLPLSEVGETDSSSALSVLSGIAEDSTDKSWITKDDGLYLVTEKDSSVNVISIGLSEFDKSIDYYMGLTSNVSFQETINLIKNSTEHSWNIPNVAVFYVYGEDDKAIMSSDLGIENKWWVDNHSELALKNLDDLVSLNSNNEVEYSPVITDRKEILLVKQNESGFSFYKVDKSEFLIDGLQVTCKDGQ